MNFGPCADHSAGIARTATEVVCPRISNYGANVQSDTPTEYKKESLANRTCTVNLINLVKVC